MIHLNLEIQNAFPFARWHVKSSGRLGVIISVQSITEPIVINHHFDEIATACWGILTADQMIKEIDGWFERGKVPHWLLKAQRAHKAREEAAAIARLIPATKSKKQDGRL